MLGTDGHRQATIDDVTHERDHDVLLLQGAQHVAHRLHRVEGAGHRRCSTDEHRQIGAAPAEGIDGLASEPVDGRVAGGDDLTGLVERTADEHRGEVRGRGGEPHVARVQRQLDRLAVDGAVGQHGDHGGQVGREPDDLDGANHGAIDARTDDDGGVLGDRGQQVGGLVEQLLEPSVGALEELPDALRRVVIEQAGAGDVVDEEAVALVGRHPSGRRVRLGEVALLLQHGHLVAHGRGADLDPGRGGDVRRADGLGRGDVLLHDGPQDGRLAFVQHLAVQAIECWRSRPGTGPAPPRARRDDPPSARGRPRSPARAPTARCTRRRGRSARPGSSG